MAENNHIPHGLAPYMKTPLYFNYKGLALLLIIFLPIYIGSALWENAEWNSASEELNLNTVFQYYEDAGHHLDIKQIRRHGRVQWQAPPNEKLNFGFRSSTLWLKANLTVPETDQYLLELPYSLLKSVEVYAFINGRQDYYYQTGISRGFSSRPVAHRNFLFPLNLIKGQSLTLYLKVHSDGFLKLSSRLWHKEAFYRKDQITTLVQGVFMGTFVIVILYNLLAFISLVNITQLWFVLYCTLFLIFEISIQGFGQQFIWPESVALQDISICITMILAGLVSCLFACSFLGLESNSKTVYVLMFLGLFMLSMLLVYPFAPYTTVLQLQILMNVLTATVFIIAGIHRWRLGNVETTNFIFAWLLLVTSVFFDAFEKTGIVSNLAVVLGLSSDIEVLQLISVLTIILLSFALVDKISLERKKGMLAQQELLRIKSEQTLLLETSVDQRTQELQEALHELALVNEKLNSQNNTDSLTGAFNRHYFIQNFESWVSQHRKQRKPFSLVMLDIDHFKKLNDKFGHLFGDYCLVTLAKLLKNRLRDHEQDCLCRYGGEEFALMLPETDTASALEIAEKLRITVENCRFTYEQIDTNITISAGVATIPGHVKKNSKWLFSVCDQALYQAKAEGRNRVVVHQQKHTEEHYIAG